MDIIFYVRWTIHYTVVPQPLSSDPEFPIHSRHSAWCPTVATTQYVECKGIAKVACVLLIERCSWRVKFDRGLRQLTGYVSSETLPTDAAPELRRNVQHMLSYSCCEDSRPAGSTQWLTCSLERHWSVNRSGISPEEWLKLRSLLDSRYREWQTDMGPANTAVLLAPSSHVAN